MQLKTPGRCSAQTGVSHQEELVPSRLVRGTRTIAAALLALALSAAPAAARDDAVTSFDGTNIVLHWFPTDAPSAGGKAPTVLFGPGWAQAGGKNADQPSDQSIGYTGVGALR